MYKELKIKEIKYEIPPKGVALIVTNKITVDELRTILRKPITYKILELGII